MATHLRIAFFTPSFLPKCSGAEIFHYNLASRLVEAGHHVAVVLPRRYLSELAGISGRLTYDLIPYPRIPGVTSNAPPPSPYLLTGWRWLDSRIGIVSTFGTASLLIQPEFVSSIGKSTLPRKASQLLPCP